MNRALQILSFWFGDDPNDPLMNSKTWWEKNPHFDKKIKIRFEEDLNRAVDEEYDSWKESPHECLAYIILLDQFSRNIYRNTPRAFTQDPLALAACVEGINKGFDRHLTPIQRSFFYMPLMHSEDLKLQQYSIQNFRKLAEEAPEDLKKNLENSYQYALKHYEIVKRFGHFPHRNAILGRPSTTEEIEFLKQPGASF
jgi:uncharacterized protein (DUF924 family)